MTLTRTASFSLELMRCFSLSSYQNVCNNSATGQGETMGNRRNINMRSSEAQSHDMDEPLMSNLCTLDKHVV